MKNKSLVIILLFLLFSANSSQGQIWKQIQNAAQNRALDKSVKKVGNQVGDPDNRNAPVETSLAGFGKNKVDVSVVPDSYNFSWKYVMEIKTDDGKTINADYLLEPEVSYFGFKVGEGKGQNMLMIMDVKNRLTVSCFGDGKDKMASASILPDYSEMANEDAAHSKFAFKTLPNKTFLGYNCKGV
jgi:hypothetical protein